MMNSDFSTFAQMQLEAYRGIVKDLERIVGGLAPTAEELANAPLLSHWVFVPSQDACLFGVVEGHPLIGPGLINTSIVCALDPRLEWARTHSRWYRLGPRFEAQGVVQ